MIGAELSAVHARLKPEASPLRAGLIPTMRSHFDSAIPRHEGSSRLKRMLERGVTSPEEIGAYHNGAPGKGALAADASIIL